MRAGGGDTPREAEFRDIVRASLRVGRMPTPSLLLRVAPWAGHEARGNGGPMISGRYSRIRIEELRGAGYEIHGFDNARWHPRGSCARQENCGK